MTEEKNIFEAVKAAQPQIAVLGVGAIEQHGAHLPVGTDWIIASELSRRVADELKAWLLPAIPVSMSECHGLLAGSVWLKPATLAAVIQDIAADLHALDIHKLLIVNAHGGNFILEPVIETINERFPRMMVIMPAEAWPDVDDNGAIFETGATDLHAGEIETSLLLYLCPELVKPGKVDFVPGVGREFLDYATIERICPEGVWGHARKGNAGKGERAFVAQVRAICTFARQAFEAQP